MVLDSYLERTVSDGSVLNEKNVAKIKTLKMYIQKYFVTGGSIWRGSCTGSRRRNPSNTAIDMSVLRH